MDTDTKVILSIFISIIIISLYGIHCAHESTMEAISKGYQQCSELGTSNLVWKKECIAI